MREKNEKKDSGRRKQRKRGGEQRRIREEIKGDRLRGRGKRGEMRRDET